MSIIAKKLSKIKPSPTIAVTTKAKELRSEGKDVIGLGAGEPDFHTPDNVKQATIQAVNDNITNYTPVDGLPSLKQAICKKFQDENNLSFSPENISVGTGAKQVIYNALMASLDEGDEVIIPAPYWVSYPDMVLLSGGKPVIVKSGADNGFKITAESLNKAITDKTKWLILNSPSNPTGATYSKQELRQLADVILQHDHVHVISDDIYEHIIFDDFSYHTIAEIEPKLKDRVLTVNGVSKAYSMTGFRIGYAAGNPAFIKAISKVQSQSTSNPCSISQMAALEALSGRQDYLAERAASFQTRRNMVVERLNDIKGISCNLPEGAFYVFPSIVDLLGKKTENGELIATSVDFTKHLLEQRLVAAVAGSAFGLEGFFRISYATSVKDLETALNRIKDFCETLA